MAKKSIEVLFQKEEYDKAITTIKQMLKEDTDNGELIYYLFLAENKDYANIDLNNIVNEVNFNRALDLSNRRLRNEFEAEYNFYRDSDPVFRKMFCYARRENKNKVLELFGKTDYEVKLPNNLDEYFDNMDYVVTSRITKTSLELNLLIVNLLFILTKEKRLIDIIKEIKKILIEIEPRYEEFKIFIDKNKLYDFIFNPQAYEEIELIEIKEEKAKDNIDVNPDIIDAKSYYFNNEYIKAYELFKKHSSNIEAKFFLGMCYIYGLGVEKNLNYGVGYILDSARCDYTVAQNELGRLIEEEIIADQPENAFGWYKKAALSGNIDAIYNLGNCYERGYGTAINIDDALKWYYKGNSLKSKKCTLKLAEYFDKKGDYNKALIFYLNYDKDPDVAYKLSCYYYNGIGVGRNDAKGKRYLEYAASKGQEKAIEKLKVMEKAKLLGFNKENNAISKNEVKDEQQDGNKSKTIVAKDFILIGIIVYFAIILIILITSFLR